MALRHSITSAWVLANLLSLLACGGMGGPIAPMQGPAGDGAEGSLAAPDAAGGGAYPGGPAPEGEEIVGRTSVPSTQQSEPGVGKGHRCLYSLRATVKVLRGGIVDSCLGTSRVTKARARDGITATAEVLALPDNPAPGPKVTVTYQSWETAGVKTLTADTVCDHDGLWKTPEGALRLVYGSMDPECKPFLLESSARWELEEKMFTSETVSPQLPPPSKQPAEVWVPLTLSLGSLETVIPALETLAQ